jgi:tetratricopeptide (TPR) repeat protein
MAHAVDSRLSTPITELRSDLDKAERMLPQLDAANVGDYLAHLDRLQALFDQVDGDDADLRSELTRWSDLQAQIAQRAGAIVRAAGGATSYRTLRAQHPPATGTWWHLDELLAAQRQRQLRRTAITLGVVAVVLIVATLVYRTWLAPSPEVMLQVSALHDIESAAMAQDWATAYAIAQSTLEKLPDDSQLLVWAGVIAEQLGDTDAAAAYLARARAALTAEPLNYHLSLAQTRFQANDLDRAVEAAKAAEAVAPDDPRVAFVFGSIAEAQGHLREAIQHFERVASLAEDSDPQLAVMSKMRMATLLQSLQMNPAADEPSAVPGGTPIP